jgi:hypothetical protein
MERRNSCETMEALLMTLYNLRSALDDYRITKFTQDLDVESSYLLTRDELGALQCECPAGVRPSCRHRQMLGCLLPLVDTEWFWNYERTQIVDANGNVKPAIEPMPPLPAGVIMVSLDEPATLHNAIAEAVGEPESILPPAKPWRRI